MARVAIILPHGDMSKAAYEMARQYELDLMEVAVLDNANTLDTPETTSDTFAKVRTAIAAGAEIIISRGGHAQFIRSITDIPVIEIRLTMHEIGLLISKAKKLSKKSEPIVSFVGPSNMFCSFDMEEIHRLYGVQFRYYQVDMVMESIVYTATQAAQENTDVLIGGKEACTVAAEQGILSIRTESGKESLAEACRVAQYVSYAVDFKKKNTANFKAILDYTYSGILQIDENGYIQHISQFVEQLLNKSEAEVQGRLVWNLIPSLSQRLIQPVLKEAKEIYSTRIALRRSEFMTSIVPVIVDNYTITGAIVCFYEGKQQETFASEKHSALSQRGCAAHFSFREIIARSDAMKEVILQAKRCSKFDCPILILGECGTEKKQLAACIYNDSPYAKQTFQSIFCDGLSPMETEQILCGKTPSQGATDLSGLLDREEGVLYLHEVSALSSCAQYKLYQLLIRNTSDSLHTKKIHRFPLRIIASDSHDLRNLVQQGKFRFDLYYVLSVAVLHIPPLRERREDIDGWIEFYINRYQKQYGRFVHLTQEAMQLLHDYNWPGNLSELRNICQRILSMSPKRTVNARFVATQIDQNSDYKVPSVASVPIQVNPNIQAVQITDLIKKHGGNHTAAAHEMGISTTTLWRRMKKLGIK